MEDSPMKRSFALVVIVVIAALMAAPAWNFQDKKPIAAYIMKVVNNVERRSSPSTGWTKALLLNELKAGYEVRTQEKSFAMIKFADDSKVAVREKSIITIQGDVDAKGKILNRDVYIERGRTAFDVKKQQTEQFRFTSPISVASIRGTEGGTGFDPGQNLADITIITGIAEFSSTRSGCKVDVRAGQTGRIDSSASCKSDTASRHDLNNNNPHSDLNQGVTPPDTSKQGGGAPPKTVGPTTKFTLNPLSGTLETGKDVGVQVSIVHPPVEISQVTMFYRNQGEPAYKQATMTIAGVTNLSCKISGSDVKAGTTKTFEYYFSMQGSNGTTYTFPETSPETSPYTLPIKPRTVFIRIPVTDPTGQARFLQISYDE
jgi:hypothetical protein